jgi:hypothetical protein
MSGAFTVMSASHLAIVSPASPSHAPVDAIAQRIRQLRDEARALAHEQVERLQQSLLETARLAAEITDGGDAYPVGAREIARRLVEDATQQAMTLTAIVGRDHH